MPLKRYETKSELQSPDKKPVNTFRTESDFYSDSHFVNTPKVANQPQTVEDF